MTCPDCLVVTGPMGVGKTTVGKLLAETLHRPLIDSDAVLEALTGRSGRDLAAAGGVHHLHEIEADILSAGLRTDHPAVIAAAASICDRDDLLADVAARRAALVYLDGDSAELHGRAAATSHRRPVSAVELVALTDRRKRLALEHGAVVVDTRDHSSPAAVASAVLESLPGDCPEGRS